MISRAHMRRQLRANGGITNLRQGYGLGDFVRKLIPNELADLASKAAPFVAPFNPLAAGIMRGVGRYDKRGSLKDALKQGVLTYAGGKGARYLGGVDKTLMPGQGSRGFDFTMDKFKEGPLGNITKDFREGMKDPTKRVKDAAESVGRPTMDDIANKDSIFKKAGKFYDDLNPVVKGQIITGGGTFIATLVSEALKNEPKRQLGETIEEYNARRKQKVSSYLRTYLSNTRPTASTEEIDTLVERYTSEYNQGGRGGYQTGGITMTNTLAQNRAINNARRAANQQQLQKGRDVQEATQLLDQAVGPSGNIGGLTDIYNKYFYGKGNLGSLAFNQGTTSDTLGQYHSIDAKSRPQIIKDLAYQLGQQRSQANVFKTADDAFRKANPNYYVRGTGIPRGPNGGYIIDGVEYFSEQEAIDAMGMDRYAQVMSKGGRVGFSQGSDLKIKLKQIGYEDTLLDRMSLKELRELLDSEKGTFTDQGTYREPGNMGGRVGLSEGTNELMKRIEELMDEGLDYGAARAQAEREMSSKNMGGIMRTGLAIGSPDKQLEAGAPPIMYSGNMDPNQKTGLPSIPGPIQMAEDGPEFDMRENGGFQPLGRQEGKDDVPAMLAKNEFVMTADAVRAAGGGSIEKGAQKMYDTMKKLESRVS